jgi:hypothetical protein
MFAQALGESVSPGVENRAKEPRRPEFIVKGLTPPQQLADGPGNRIMSPSSAHAQRPAFEIF